MTLFDGPHELLSAADLGLVLAATGRAGEAILEVYRSDFAVQLKNDRSPLTIADKRSHEHLNKVLSSLQQAYPVLSEEGVDTPYERRKDWTTFWLVDPLDGTKEFIRGTGEFTVNVALIHRSRPVLGIIYAPVPDMLYLGCERSGAHRMDRAALDTVIRALSTADTPAPDGLTALLSRSAFQLTGIPGSPRPFTVVASRSHLSLETERRLSDLKREHPDLAVLSAGSSLKFCLIAEGSADEYPRFAPTMEWDSAAGQVIIEQAGGRVTSWETGMPLAYNKQNLLNPWFVARRG